MSVFFRQDIACQLSPAPDGWGFRAFFGVEPSHPAARKTFISRRSGPPLEHVIGLRSTSLDNKWWFVLECCYANEDKALEELAAAADELNAMMP